MTHFIQPNQRWTDINCMWFEQGLSWVCMENQMPTQILYQKQFPIYFCNFILPSKKMFATKFFSTFIFGNMNDSWIQMEWNKVILIISKIIRMRFVLGLNNGNEKAHRILEYHYSMDCQRNYKLSSNKKFFLFKSCPETELNTFQRNNEFHSTRIYWFSFSWRRFCSDIEKDWFQIMRSMAAPTCWATS